jgi:hypothetical protein
VAAYAASCEMVLLEGRKKSSRLALKNDQDIKLVRG